MCARFVASDESFSNQIQGVSVLISSESLTKIAEVLLRVFHDLDRKASTKLNCKANETVNSSSLLNLTALSSK